MLKLWYKQWVATFLSPFYGTHSVIIYNGSMKIDKVKFEKRGGIAWNS